MISGSAERPAPVGEAVCVEHVGPVWKLDGEVCGCVLPAGHLADPRSDHECSCGAWWTRTAVSEVSP